MKTSCISINQLCDFFICIGKKKNINFKKSKISFSIYNNKV